MKLKSLEAVFDAFNHQTALVIGDIMLDAYIYGQVSRISPEAPVPVVNSTKRDFRLGGAGNVARNLKALGAETIICSVVGKDDHADILETILKDRSISSEGIQKSDARPTTVKTRVISGSQQMLRIDDESTQSLNNLEKENFSKKVLALLSKVDVVIFQDYDKGVLDEELIKTISDEANKRGVPIAVDPKKRNFLSYKNCTLFKPNLKELKEGLNIEFNINEEDKLHSAIDELRKVLDCQKTLITLSENGVLLKTDQDTTKVPAHVRSIADVSGAGDTVISIASLALSLGLSDRLIASLSNLGGGLVCEHLGVVPISKTDLYEEAKKHQLGQWL